MADDDRARDTEFVEYRLDQRGLPLDGIAGARRFRATVADQIEPDDAVIAGELRRDRVPPSSAAPNP